MISINLIFIGVVLLLIGVCVGLLIMSLRPKGKKHQWSYCGSLIPFDKKAPHHYVYNGKVMDIDDEWKCCRCGKTTTFKNDYDYFEPKY